MLSMEKCIVFLSRLLERVQVQKCSKTTSFAFTQLLSKLASQADPIPPHNQHQSGALFFNRIFTANDFASLEHSGCMGELKSLWNASNALKAGKQELSYLKVRHNLSIGINWIWELKLSRQTFLIVRVRESAKTCLLFWMKSSLS